MERATRRARLPLQYSQGFNPRPRLSLLCPRPVSVAAIEDPLLLRTERSVEPESMRDALNERAPWGLCFDAPRENPAGRTPLPARMHFVCGVADEAAVAERLAGLRIHEQWTVERIVSAGRARGSKASRPVDLRPLLAKIDVSDGQLRWQAVPSGDLWPKPAEVLRLLGLPECPLLADVVREKVELTGNGERPTDSGGTICQN